MKKILSSCLALFLFISITKSQEQADHPQKMYRNEEGRLFANKHQPMYLMLSTSPGAEGNTETLESESCPKYANPFYFDSEGLNTIRTPSQVDPETKELVYPVSDVVFQVYADGIAPTTKASFSHAQKYVRNDSIYYGAGLQIALSAYDKVSGLDKTYYSINGEEFRLSEGVINISEEKHYSLKYYSVDNVGNVESIQERQFTIDKTAPAVNWKLVGDVSGNTVSARSKIELLAVDKTTGISHIKYQLNDDPVKTYSRPIDLSMIENGNHDFKFWASDNVGNRSDGSSHTEDIAGGDMTTFSFVIDYDPPEATATIIGDQFRGKYLYVSERSRCELDAKDNQLVVDRTMFGTNRVEIDKKYEEPFAFDTEKALQSVYYQSYDMVENQSKVGKVSVFMDTEAPSSGIDYDGPQFFNRDTLFINKLTEIKLFSEDNASGVQKIISKVNGDQEQETTSFKIPDEGFYEINFSSIDNVNNRETAKTSQVYVDNEGPDVFINFSIKPTRQEKHDGQDISVYPPFVKLYIGATDKHCGTKNILYSIDGGEKKNYGSNGSPSSMELFKEERIYSVEVEAKDKLGNGKTETLQFRISKN
ncbi:OmpL47-type beta-barrel domain-containing protein [Carboxylicivirga sp. RSCT41]|uniref:OmpL47-type beta-barrel domain-containing protein n=1 Tax=Carboxylicivirga agarovorans TaxID=3417570 RepID=UPI003D34C844